MKTEEVIIKDLNDFKRYLRSLRKSRFSSYRMACNINNIEDRIDSIKEELKQSVKQRKNES